eukprot:365759-Chlamydomonas_euryale.AAC.7
MHAWGGMHGALSMHGGACMGRYATGGGGQGRMDRQVASRPAPSLMHACVWRGEEMKAMFRSTRTTHGEEAERDEESCRWKKG